uniref:EGF-like domain-containing protein n=1 Tax=Ciona savignyi TaxID=51511 RepID=H2Y5R0_CIOSA
MSLQSGSSYTVSVNAQNSAGSGSATTLLFSTRPLPPQNLVIANYNGTHAVATWSASAGAVTYQLALILEDMDPTSGKVVQYVTPGVNFPLVNLATGIQYQLNVSACINNTLCGNPAMVTFDVNECAFISNDCHMFANCTNTIGSYTCSCIHGFTGDGKNCTDINECTLGTNNCHTNATCTNTIGSFTCSCNTGFTGDGKNCTDINECTLGTDNCHTNATCTNTIGSFTCSCNTGFTGDGVNCADINECTLGTH